MCKTTVSGKRPPWEYLLNNYIQRGHTDEVKVVIAAFTAFFESANQSSTISYFDAFRLHLSIRILPLRALNLYLTDESDHACIPIEQQWRRRPVRYCRFILPRFHDSVNIRFGVDVAFYTSASAYVSSKHDIRCKTRGSWVSSGSSSPDSFVAAQSRDQGTPKASSKTQSKPRPLQTAQSRKRGSSKAPFGA
ncbi:unnamed protein product [Tilletia controversa]|nr:hypothetical protein CF328_g7316 [Tilletia controversa]KAE8195588.1 hypothetical protein CF336_g3017 [Tilletia laevis]KAE8247294.1 hypothetical protein A4X03_0g7086 [Tilletia caries]KAE8202657.1 hypothetical protein CF335_g3331 [Tilletia laevis]CAD6889411.1 unnamed protein product [Tilletia caries]